MGKDTSFPRNVNGGVEGRDTIYRRPQAAAPAIRRGCGSRSSRPGNCLANPGRHDTEFSTWGLRTPSMTTWQERHGSRRQAGATMSRKAFPLCLQAGSYYGELDCTPAQHLTQPPPLQKWGKAILRSDYNSSAVSGLFAPRLNHMSRQSAWCS